MIHRTIQSLDGKPLATAGFTRDQGDVWAWVQEAVAAEAGCHPDDVRCEETDDGDVIVAAGEPYGRLACGCNVSN